MAIVLGRPGMDGLVEAAGVAVRRGMDATASGGPGLVLAVRRGGDGRGGPCLETRRTDSRCRNTGEPWAPLRRNVTEPVKGSGVRIEVIGPEPAHVRTAVQR